LLRIELCPYPRHARNAPDAKVGQLIKGRRGEVEVSESASATTICKSNGDTLSSICGDDFLATHRVLVGVAAKVIRVTVK